MNLPVVLEIAIGLVFIYLILSLLTSEIQELIAILLQWRAEHLKRSIESLLTGENVDDPLYQKFTDDLYESPLLRSLNQEAKGLFATAFRRISQSLSHFYHSVTGTRNIFGQQTSGPSYIPAETFSVALLQKLNIEQISQKISELMVRKFSEKRVLLLKAILDDLRNSLGDNSLLESEFGHLQQSLDQNMDDFIRGRIPRSKSFEHGSAQIIQFINNTETLLENDHHCKEIIRKRLPYVKQTISQPQIEPTVVEVLRLLFEEDTRKTAGLSPWLIEIVDQLDKEHPGLLKQVSDLPPNLKQTLLSLAEQTRMKAEGLAAEVRQLETEVANWFNHSMERATGVYRRNAKGIGILIGFFVAILINADTLNMIHRLSKDSLLRESITQAANQIVEQNSPVPPVAHPGESTQNRLENVKNSVNTVLDEIPLPIGWDTVNIKEQESGDRRWPIPFLQRLIGWFVTGIALSMGASFWYDLLQRVMYVRTTGGKPEGKS
ncbi:MAG: hypothetical protein HC772_08070 [Leptolyngbyaceae cyanobacterium CRU_2_3]|nr:hypothetical protein [Leptolyngbyaceae cyanobacterium CRU_2_3]